MFDPIVARIELAFAALNRSTPAADPELDALFARLRTVRGSRRRVETTERIWKMFCTHEDDEANQAMRAVLDAFEYGDLDGVAETLDILVQRWPGWAEAWNKRATLRFAKDQDAASLDDIAQVLVREPRHFGALSGLGQISLRAGHYTAALLAFERVLAIDPGMDELRSAVEALRDQTPQVVN